MQDALPRTGVPRRTPADFHRSQAAETPAFEDNPLLPAGADCNVPPLPESPADHRTARRFELLTRATAELLSTDSPRRVLNDLCADIADLAGADLFLTYLLDPESDRLLLYGSQGLPPELLDPAQCLDLETSLAGAVVQDRSPITLTHVLDTTSPRERYVRFLGLQAYAAFPILAGPRVLGVLSFGSRAHPAFHEDDLALFKAVADQTAIVLHRLDQQRALDASEERRRLALQATRDGIWDWNPVAREYVWSDRMYDMLGYAPGELPMSIETFNTLLHPDDVAATWTAVDGYLRRETDTYQVQFRLRHKDGSYRWILSRGIALFAPDGTAVRMVGAHTDITDARRAADDLDHKTRQLNSLLTSAPVGIAFFDREHRFVEINDELAAINGLPRDSHLGRLLADILPEIAPYVLPAVDRVVATGEPIRSFEVEGETPAEPGVRRYWLNGFFPVFDSAGAVVLVGIWVVEITGRKRAEHALRDAHDKAAAAMQAKDQFLAVLSHELRTPLTPVLAAAQMLERDCRHSAGQLELLQIIRRNVELETALIDDLLDVTRIRHGKLELALATVDLHNTIHDALAIVDPDLRARQLHFTLDLAAPRHQLLADPARLQQILWNLLKNAIKFTPAGGAISLRTSLLDRFLRIDIADTGCGIEPDRLPRIFEPFEQGGRHVTRQFGGLGLGLAITKSLVDLHGGSISAVSDGKDRGCTFSVMLPLAPADAAAPDAAPPSHPRPRGHGLRVLLVEDNLDTLRVMSRLLASDGYHVATASTLADALAALHTRPFDLVISDIGLPDGSGLDLLRNASGARPPHAIALSGYGTDDDLARSKAAGFDAHLIKPVNLQLLEDTLRQLTSRLAKESVFTRRDKS